MLNPISQFVRLHSAGIKYSLASIISKYYQALLIFLSFLLQVPNLFEPEEYEKMIIGVRPHAKEANVPEHDRLVHH